LDALALAYQDFIALASAPVPDPLVGVIELVHAWRRFPFIDPELPAELLPEPWAGARAAALFAARHTSWANPARTAWVNPA
jgi:phenylacetic acid degradation operon negative regulatory protein